LLNAGLLSPQDLLMVEGVEGRRQTAALTPDGKVNVAGQFFDSVSPAAVRALELAGKSVKAVNGWAYFHVLRGGTDIGSLLDIRAQHEDKEEEPAAERAAQEGGGEAVEGPDPSVLAAVEQLKPVLALLPELTVKVAKSSASLYAGKLLVGYAHPRKKGPPRLRVYVGEICPDWAIPDPTYAPWCFIDNWPSSLERVVALLKEAPRRRGEELASGLDAYRRRSEVPSPSPPAPPES
jgi:hypothetical protein